MVIKDLCPFWIKVASALEGLRWLVKFICEERHCEILIYINSLTCRVAKTGLTILEIFLSQKRFLENSVSRNVEEKSKNNSPSNIL